MAEEAKKVLLVDDDPMVLEIFREYCTLGCIRCETARNGYRALEVFENDLEEFGVIVTDTSPGVIELARRASKKFPLLPIIIATGYQKEDVSEIIQEFRVRLLYKPIDRVTFINAIKDTLTHFAPS